ncbi:kinase-like protein [Acephala macrosclerotiorum]|nr:kinase-like protein [Acephala macrosclerotiorum]
MMDPESKKPYLLETRPGRKFRNLVKEFGLRSARSHFRSIVDSFRLKRSSRLRDILQNVDETISWVGEEKYEGMVDAIPFSELVLTNERASGNVHFAKWRCKQKLDMAEPREIEVVLKRIWPPDRRHAQMLIRELQNSIHSFATRPIGSIELCGITSVPSVPSEPSEHNAGFPPGSVFLVLERAQNLGQFLQKNLSGSPADWDLISELFGDLATSLESLHEGDDSVIHRDIHMDNIVLRQQPCPNDPYVDTENELVIIDLGESQRSNSASQTINTYGNADYRAPEVTASREYSEKSDVFSVGYVMVEIIRQRCHVSKESRVPKPLWDLIHKCLARDATDRPSASELVQGVEEIRETFFWVPEEISKQNRGRVIFPDELSEDFSVVVPAWKKSLTEQESGSEDDIGMED